MTQLSALARLGRTGTLLPVTGKPKVGVEPLPKHEGSRPKLKLANI